MAQENFHSCGLKLSSNLWSKIGYTDALVIFCDLKDWTNQINNQTVGMSSVSEDLTCNNGDYIDGIQAKYEEGQTDFLAYIDLGSTLSTNDWYTAG